MKELDHSFKRLYECFSKYKFNPEMIFCDHCKEEEDVKKVGSKPLRELTAEDLGYYFSSSMTTMGDIDDFKYFLPRILEIFVYDAENFPYDFELFCSKLNYAKWKSWDAFEIDNIKSVLLEYWRYKIKKHSNLDYDVPSIQDVILGFAICEKDLKVYFQIWEECFEENGLICFIDFLSEIVDSIIDGSDLNAYLAGDKAIQKAIVEWAINTVHRENVRDHIQKLPNGYSWQLDLNRDKLLSL